MWPGPMSQGNSFVKVAVVFGCEANPMTLDPSSQCNIVEAYNDSILMWDVFMWHGWLTGFPKSAICCMFPNGVLQQWSIPAV